jgi:hypothetical protein
VKWTCTSRRDGYWFPWFAWHPVVLSYTKDGSHNKTTWIWWEHIERTMYMGYYRYRRPKNEPL